MLLSLMKKIEKLKKRHFKNVEEKNLDCLDKRKTIMVVDFNDRGSASIKSFPVKKRSKVKVNIRFMSGKLLMFAKLSLKSFIYDPSEIFCFPTKVVSDIRKKYLIEKVEIFHILTDTDSTALKFISISDPNSDVPEDKFRDMIFEVIIATKIYKRFDASHEF